MIDALMMTLQLVGALGVFLLGMKLMSEALQKVAGSRLKGLLSRITTNRFSGVLTGLAITAIVQSSSATTVMVVSFVNAELMSLMQAIGVIMGANIGTTVTGWLVALLGFKVKLTAFALPAVGIGFGMSFLKGARPRQWGEALVGFGLLFLGLGLLKNAVPGVSDPAQLEWMADLASHGFGSVLLFVLIGTVLTIVLQSSSATMTLTLTLAARGWLPYEVAAAMVLGENIGTTATANLAAIGASTNARRAARAHLLFNIFGVVWALALLRLYLLPVVDWLVPGDPSADFAALQGDPTRLAIEAGVVTTHLAAMHTLFNITNTGIMLPFVQRLAWVVERWVPEPKQGADAHFKYLAPGFIETPELLLVQARREMQHMASLVREMFVDALRVVTHPDESLGELVERTLAREDLTDRMELEITQSLTQTARAATSAEASRRVAAMVQNTHRLERIADHCAVLIRIARRAHQQGRSFGEAEVVELHKLGSLVERSLDEVGLYLGGEGAPGRAEQIEGEIDLTRRQLRERHIHRLEDDAEDVMVGLAFLDTITHLEEIGDRAVGIIRYAETMRQL